MANGIIIINKEQDWTSHDVVAKLRGILRERRIGHAGTLDPMATGVLPVFVGRGTRAVEFAAEGEKEYLAGLQLGQITDTQDTTGTTVERRPVTATQRDLADVLPQFTGEITQIPPMYSAIKREGKKLYELARKGIEVERAPRPITIHSIKIEGEESDHRYLLRVRCSKGTYIRTLCHDIGQALGCGGTMYSLTRTMACGFTLEDGVTLEAVQQSHDPAQLLRPVDSYFGNYPAYTVTPQAEGRIRNGCAVPTQAETGTWRVYSETGAFLMLGQSDGATMTTIKSFYEV